MVWRFDWQELPKQLTVECDSDFAGCLRTRKSTSGYASFMGKHCVAARSKTQSVIATSSGEAELYALGSAVSNGLGLCSVLADLGVKMKLIVHMDASAGIAMASRRGLGRAKHIHVQYLWMQDQITRGEITLKKIAGEQNRSDLMTKHLARERMEELMKMMQCEYKEGKSQIALKAF